MIKEVQLIIILVFVALVLPVNAFASTIDCFQTKELVELQICRDENLLTIDKNYFEEYGMIAFRFSKIESFYIQEDYWRKEVRNKCQTKECIVNAYELRLKELKSITPESFYQIDNSKISKNKLINSEIETNSITPKLPDVVNDNDSINDDDLVSSEIPAVSNYVDQNPIHKPLDVGPDSYAKTTKESIENSSIAIMIIAIFLLVFVLSIIYAFFGGLKNELIIFNNTSDLIFTTLSWVIPSFIMGLYYLYPNSQYKIYFLYTGIGTFPIGILAIIRRSVFLNHGLIQGVSVATLKIILSFIGVVYVLSLFIGKRKKYSKHTTIVSIFIFVILSRYFERMINGKKVETNRRIEPQDAYAI